MYYSVPIVPMFAREWAKHQRPLGIRSLVMRAAEITGYPPATIVSPIRSGSVVLVRFAVIRTARRAGYSSPQIGKVINRDHSSIIHGEKRAEGLMQTCPSFATLCASLEEPA